MEMHKGKGTFKRKCSVKEREGGKYWWRWPLWQPEPRPGLGSGEQEGLREAPGSNHNRGQRAMSTAGRQASTRENKGNQ